jgi:hypothetical protein
MFFGTMKKGFRSDSEKSLFHGVKTQKIASSLFGGMKNRFLFLVWKIQFLKAPKC